MLWNTYLRFIPCLILCIIYIKLKPPINIAYIRDFQTLSHDYIFGVSRIIFIISFFFWYLEKELRKNYL